MHAKHIGDQGSVPEEIRGSSCKNREGKIISGSGRDDKVDAEVRLAAWDDGRRRNPEMTHDHDQPISTDMKLYVYVPVSKVGNLVSDRHGRWRHHI